MKIFFVIFFLFTSSLGFAQTEDIKSKIDPTAIRDLQELAVTERTIIGNALKLPGDAPPNQMRSDLRNAANQALALEFKKSQLLSRSILQSAKIIDSAIDSDLTGSRVLRDMMTWSLEALKIDEASVDPKTQVQKITDLNFSSLGLSIAQYINDLEVLFDSHKEKAASLKMALGFLFNNINQDVVMRRSLADALIEIGNYSKTIENEFPKEEAQSLVYESQIKSFLSDKIEYIQRELSRTDKRRPVGSPLFMGKTRDQYLSDLEAERFPRGKIDMGDWRGPRRLRVMGSTAYFTTDGSAIGLVDLKCIAHNNCQIQFIQYVGGSNISSTPFSVGVNSDGVYIDGIQDFRKFHIFPEPFEDYPKKRIRAPSLIRLAGSGPDHALANDPNEKHRLNYESRIFTLDSTRVYSVSHEISYKYNYVPYKTLDEGHFVVHDLKTGKSQAFGPPIDGDLIDKNGPDLIAFDRLRNVIYHGHVDEVTGAVSNVEKFFSSPDLKFGYESARVRNGVVYVLVAKRSGITLEAILDLITIDIRTGRRRDFEFHNTVAEDYVNKLQFISDFEIFDRTIIIAGAIGKIWVMDLSDFKEIPSPK